MALFFGKPRASEVRKGKGSDAGLRLSQGEWIEVQGSVPFVGRREVVRPRGQIAKIESHGQISIEAVYVCGSHSLGFWGTSVLVHRDGNNVFPSWTEIRKENVCGCHAPRQGYGRNGLRYFGPRDLTSDETGP